MKFRIIAIAAIALGSAAAAQPAQGPLGADLATLIAAQMQPRLPAETSPGARMIAVRSDGNLLVQTFEVSVEHYDLARDRNAASGGAFREGFCRTEARFLFERGVALRVELTDGTRTALSLPVITDCPPRE